MSFIYNLKGLEENIIGGAHIHTGTTCNDADLVGGHYWASGDDVWTPTYGAFYSTDDKGNAMGEFDIDSGYDYFSNLGHAVVVHASDGSRIGCGILVRRKAQCGKSKDI
mmetsp:Transcript_5138/g.6638  ORF Transcript_5138/g.6638 Transcript_5138/m.6638 type:complete len:109 (+) Transcript_5138:219-545(+)